MLFLEFMFQVKYWRGELGEFTEGDLYEMTLEDAQRDFDEGDLFFEGKSSVFPRKQWSEDPCQ